MENFGRREFIKKAAFSSSLLLTGNTLFAKSHNKIHIDLPKKPFEYHIKKGKIPGKRVLIIGGIHGNEIGAYKSADLLTECEVTKGELIIVPRSNFVSILAKTRGYNGDMNRKFEHISQKDPDYLYVTALKELILHLKPDSVISMHDGLGFHRLNHKSWGQCVVIDEIRYKDFELFKKAKFVVEEANKSLNKKEWLGVYNTYTFSKNIHKEQKLALTGWCLKQGFEAYCIESSRNLPLSKQIDSHLAMLEAFFKIYHIQTSPTLRQIRQKITAFLPSANPMVVAKINGARYRFCKDTLIKLKRGTDIIIDSIEGARGAFLVPKGINLNWNSFYFSQAMEFEAKHDYLRKFRIKIVPI